MVSNSIDPQSMTNAQIQHCKNCGKRVSETDKFCPHCKKDLSEVGRNISLSVSDYIKVSDEVKVKISPENIKWDPQSLTFLGVVTTVFLGIESLFVALSDLPLKITLLLSFSIAIFSIILVTRVRFIKNVLIKIIVWFLK